MIMGRPPPTCSSVFVVALFLLLVQTQGYKVDYEWESLDFYQILGFPSSSTQSSDSITPKDIRTGYRQQARQWHPDKLIGKSNVTEEEGNYRFARIAEAYQVLSDVEKRREYDHYLLTLQRQEKSQQDWRRQQGASRKENWKDKAPPSLWNHLQQMDPRRIFEEFFNSDSWSFEHEEEKYGDPTLSSFFDEIKDAYSASFSSYSSPSNGHVNVEEREEILVDSRTGQEILRVYRTEDWISRSSRRCYRVMRQDFVEDWDHWQGTWVYIPLSEAVLVEEGYRDDDRRQQHQRNSSSTTAINNILKPGNVLYPESPDLVNGRYVSGLSRTCELYIAIQYRHDRFDDDEVVWTSETHVQQKSSSSCQLKLHGPHLVLLGQGPHYYLGPQLLWRSQSLKKEDNNYSLRGEVHMARLDTDGSLAVYRVTPLDPFWLTLLSSLDLDSRREQDTRAAKTFKEMVFLLGGVSRPSNIDEGGSFHDDSSLTRWVCISATGPVGCFRLGRLLLRVARDVKHYFYRFRVVRSLVREAKAFTQFWLRTMFAVCSFLENL